jgi:hypothetical protein
LINDKKELTDARCGLSFINKFKLLVPMHLFTILPRTLHSLFTLLRYLVLLLAVFWFFNLTFNTWIQKRFTDNPKLIVTVGDVSLKNSSDTVRLNSDTAGPGALAMTGLRGTLQTDLLSKDPALVSALRWTMLPSMAVYVSFAWLLFGSLRTVCGNIERGEVFTGNNFRLVRRVGLILIAYTLVGFAVQFWGAHVMGSYFSQHVTATLNSSSLQIPTALGALKFSTSAGNFPEIGGLVTGLMVLLISEAFRQGMTLKAENDLTV